MGLGGRSAVATSVAAGLILSTLTQPPAAGAEGIPIELIQGFLDEVQAVGPLGPGLFVLAVTVAELIPLFPTQPLALTAGLLFGTFEGAACMLTGTSLAALIAFSIARRTGGGMDFFKGEGGGDDATWKKALSKVQAAIDSGDLSQQLLAMTVLRLTPVTPFSASNYILGLTPLPLPAFMGGTVIGMGIWSVVYASIGGAGRSVLRSGVGLDTLLADMGRKASEYTEEAAVVAGVAALAALGVWYVRRKPEHTK